MLYCKVTSKCDCDLPKLHHLPKDHPCYEYVTGEANCYKCFWWYTKCNKVVEHKAKYVDGVNKRCQVFDAEEKHQDAQYIREVREHISTASEYE